MMTLQIGMTAAPTTGGGADRYFFNLIRSLPPLGVGIRGLVVGDSKSLAQTTDVESFAGQDTGMLQRWSSLRGAVARALPQIDLVASHFAAYAFPVLPRVGARPLVVHFHGSWALESAAEGAGKLQVAVKRWIERSVYRRGTRFIVLSRAYAKLVEREYGAPADLIRVVPGGVDLGRFRVVASRADARRQLGWPVDRPIVATVCRLIHNKGVENVIDAIDRVRFSHPDVLTVIAGTGPLAGDLQRRVREHGLEQWVRFAGHVAHEDLPMMYRAADLFVAPTTSLEGFGLVVVEALACGTPALVTPVGGLPEVVTPLEPALVLQGTGPLDIAAGVNDALAGRIPLPDTAACVAYAQRFDWSVIAESVRDVYGEVA